MVRRAHSSCAPNSIYYLILFGGTGWYKAGPGVLDEP
jgi:hypothetical protein